MGFPRAESSSIGSGSDWEEASVSRRLTPSERATDTGSERRLIAMGPRAESRLSEVNDVLGVLIVPVSSKDAFRRMRGGSDAIVDILVFTGNVWISRGWTRMKSRGFGVSLL
jgi:hypothetical protein